MNNSQEFESYVPVYDAIPDDWQDARSFIVEQFKLLANAINVKEIGFYLDEELLSGKQFVPSATNNTGAMDQLRDVFRIVVNVSPLIAGANPVKPHGITIDGNFTLVDLWVAATDTAAFTSQVITDSNVTLDATNINITSPAAFDTAWCIIEYLQEP